MVVVVGLGLGCSGGRGHDGVGVRVGWLDVRGWGGVRRRCGWLSRWGRESRYRCASYAAIISIHLKTGRMCCSSTAYTKREEQDVPHRTQAPRSAILLIAVKKFNFCFQFFSFNGNGATQPKLQLIFSIVLPYYKRDAWVVGLTIAFLLPQPPPPPPTNVTHYTNI